jgi:hypothetical protein
MTITLKIDNPDIEQQLMQFIKQQQEITIEALRHFLNSFHKKEQFVFQKKDPRKHSSKIEYIDEDNEDLSNVKPYSHIEDSGQYIHDLRRERVR